MYNERQYLFSGTAHLNNRISTRKLELDILALLILLSFFFDTEHFPPNLTKTTKCTLHRFNLSHQYFKLLGLYSDLAITNMISFLFH